MPSEIFSEPAKPVFRDSSDESSSEEEAEGEEECDQQKDAMDIDCQSQTGETEFSVYYWAAVKVGNMGFVMFLDLTVCWCRERCVRSKN